VSPWAASAPPRRSRRSPCTSRATSPASPPAPSTSSTAASASDPPATKGANFMKLLRYGPAGHGKPGILGRGGRIRDLSGTVSDIGPDAISPASLDKLRRIDPATLPGVVGTPRIGPCVARVSKLLCVGLNYRLHAQE